MLKKTLKDVALAAGVSPATVSNALNNRRGVSDEIREKIFQTARELGYSRESGARKPAVRLVVLKRHGLVVSDTPFFAALIEGIEKQCRLQGHELLVSHIHLPETDRADLLQRFSTDHAAGVIILATEMLPEDLALLSHLRIPVVLLDSRFPGCSYDRVLIDNEGAAFTATGHLVEQGHRSIGYLFSAVPIQNFLDRAAGFRQALRQNGLQPESCCRIALEPTLEGACRDMNKVLAERSGTLPTAFFADNDIIACGAMKALQERGFRVPEDISLVGIDDMPFCELTGPRLTTVRVFKQEIGGIAVRRLMEKIAGDPVVLQIEVGAELVVRDSVRRLSIQEPSDKPINRKR